MICSFWSADSGEQTDKRENGFRVMVRPLVLYKTFRWVPASCRADDGAASPQVSRPDALVVPQGGAVPTGASGPEAAAVAAGRAVCGAELWPAAHLLHPGDAAPWCWGHAHCQVSSWAPDPPPLPPKHINRPEFCVSAAALRWRWTVLWSPWFTAPRPALWHCSWKMDRSGNCSGVSQHCSSAAFSTSGSFIWPFRSLDFQTSWLSNIIMCFW